VAKDKEHAENQVHLILGDDQFDVDRKARAVVDEWCPPADQALGLEIMDGAVELVEEAETVLKQTIFSLQTVGFLGGKKVVWLRNASMLGEGVSAKSETVKAQVARLAELVKKGMPPEQYLVVSTTSVDKRLAFYKVFKAHAQVTEFHLPARSNEADATVAAQVEEMWKALDLQPETRACVVDFVGRVGVDMRRLQSESEKVSAYLGPDRRKVTLADLAEIVSPGRDAIVWSLADHVAKRETARAVAMFRQLLFQRESPLGLMFGLESRFRELAILKECIRRKWLQRTSRGGTWSQDPAADAALNSLAKDPRKVNPYRLAILLEQADKFTLRELLRAQRLLADTHEQMVSESIPAPLAMEALIIQLAGGRQLLS
jgi:DNA polymerase III subunit delta